MPDIMVNGIVSSRNGKPYIQLSNEKGLIAQLSMSEARQLSMDILIMASRAEADAMLVKFFAKAELPEVALSHLLVGFRDFRHELDMEKAIRTEGESPEEPTEG